MFKKTLKCMTFIKDACRSWSSTAGPGYREGTIALTVHELLQFLKLRIAISAEIHCVNVPGCPATREQTSSPGKPRGPRWPPLPGTRLVLAVHAMRKTEWYGGAGVSSEEELPGGVAI
jgi:hypothetical protein